MKEKDGYHEDTCARRRTEGNRYTIESRLCELKFVLVLPVIESESHHTLSSYCRTTYGCVLLPLPDPSACTDLSDFHKIVLYMIVKPNKFVALNR